MGHTIDKCITITLMCSLHYKLRRESDCRLAVKTTAASIAIALHHLCSEFMPGEEGDLPLESFPRGGYLVRIVTSKHPYLPVTHCPQLEIWGICKGYVGECYIGLCHRYGGLFHDMSIPLTSPIEPQVLKVVQTTDRRII